ncbi:tyrosine-type recombinase/integrase [Viscerimonas tarda]
MKFKGSNIVALALIIIFFASGFFRIFANHPIKNQPKEKRGKRLEVSSSWLLMSFHTARHSYATSVCLANGVSMENVAKMLGHASTNVTKHYAKVLDSSIMRDMANVESCFANVYQPKNQAI